MITCLEGVSAVGCGGLESGVGSLRARGAVHEYLGAVFGGYGAVVHGVGMGSCVGGEGGGGGGAGASIIFEVVGAVFGDGACA